MDPTDAELLVLIRERDRWARDTFALRHLEWAVSYASKHGAGDLTDDVAQDVLVEVIERPPEALRGTSARPYLGVAIKREIRRLQGKPLILVAGGESRLVNVAAKGTSPTAAVARLQLLRPALEVIAELPTPKHDVMMLRQQGLSFTEIAAITGRGASKEQASHYRVLERVRQKVRELLGITTDADSPY